MALAVLEQLDGLSVLDLLGPDAEETRDRLKVVLHPVVRFPEQRVFLSERRIQVSRRPLPFGYIPRKKGCAPYQCILCGVRPAMNLRVHRLPADVKKILAG